MPFFDTHPAATADARDAAAALDDALGRAEIDIYSSTAGILERAADLEAAARRAGLASRARRAMLLRSDALSRRGDLGPALDLQVDVLAAAERSGDRAICARAQCLLASTYERLADLARSQAAAEASVRLLEAADPPAWHAEHTMVLALFTSFRRRSTVDFTTFDEATRLARTVGDPRLLVAVLNNYAWSALDSDEATGLLVAEQLHAV